MSIKQEKLTRRHEIFTTTQANGIKWRKQVRATVCYAHIFDAIVFSADPLSLLYAFFRSCAVHMMLEHCFSYRWVLEPFFLASGRQASQSISSHGICYVNTRSAFWVASLTKESITIDPCVLRATWHKHLEAIDERVSEQSSPMRLSISNRMQKTVR